MQLDRIGRSLSNAIAEERKQFDKTLAFPVIGQQQLGIENTSSDKTEVYVDLDCFISRGLNTTPLEVFRRFAEFRLRYKRWERLGENKPLEGLMVFGPVGCGKTTLVQCALDDTGFVFTSSSEVLDNYRVYGAESFSYDKMYLSEKDVVLDDLGVGGKVMIYGNTWDMAEWLDWRYSCFKRNNALTVITTNFANRQNIADQYGERIKSRLMEMCDAVKYSHTDRREEINRRRYEAQRKN